jgi:hypothetical protein
MYINDPHRRNGCVKVRLNQRVQVSILPQGEAIFTRFIMANIRFRTPIWQPQSRTRRSTDSVVAIVPCSSEAQAVLKLAPNRNLLHKSDESIPKIIFPSISRSAPCYTKISFATFLGRRAVSIGSSRSSEVMLPRSLSPGSHLLIHFDLQTAGILLTDKSAVGTWVKPSPKAQWQLLHNTTRPLFHNVEVRFGQDTELRFLLVVETYASAISEFESLYQEYTHSLYTAIRWLPQCSKRRKSSYSRHRERRLAICS